MESRACSAQEAGLCSIEEMVCSEEAPVCSVGACCCFVEACYCSRTELGLQVVAVVAIAIPSSSPTTAVPSQSQIEVT
jgi:hypothetical protein